MFWARSECHDKTAAMSQPAVKAAENTDAIVFDREVQSSPVVGITDDGDACFGTELSLLAPSGRRKTSARWVFIFYLQALSNLCTRGIRELSVCKTSE